MQHKTRRFLPALVAFGITMAALMAPPSVFDHTAEAVAPALPGQPVGAIRIGLGRSQAGAEISAPGGLYVVGDGAIHWQTPPGTAVKVTLEAGQIQVVGLAKQFAGAVRFVPVGPQPALVQDAVFPPPAPANPVSYNRKPYRGEIEVLISPKDKRLSVVNVVNLDEYLLGVVPKEMPYTWPAEALKAQAVAARTYAMRNRGQYSAEGFDLVDTPMSQAYGGLSGEQATTGNAVANTRGHVLTYNGQLAVTFYHSSSGGHTENNEIIFVGPPIPYLRGVPDFDNQPGNSKFAWRYSYTPDEFAREMAESSYAMGQVYRVEPTGAVGSSGRPSQWSLVGLSGSVTVSAQQFRNALGLPSSVRSVTVKAGGTGNLTRTYQTAETLHVVGADGIVRPRPAKGAVVLGASPATVTQEVTAAVTAMGPAGGQQSAGIEVAGGGHGHAVGMSQWGANGMAIQGKTYVEILTHFYQGTRVENR